MLESSIVGVFKTIVFIIGVSVIIRFIGRLLIIKRNINDEKDFLEKRNLEIDLIIQIILQGVKVLKIL